MYYSLFKDASWTCGNVGGPLSDQTLKFTHIDVRKVGLGTIQVEPLQNLQRITFTLQVLSDSTLIMHGPLSYNQYTRLVHNTYQTLARVFECITLTI